MIKTFLKLSAASAVILLSAALAARAAITTGTYINSDMGTNVLLWDITGAYSVDDPDLGSLDAAITNEPSGAYTGTGTVFVDHTFTYKGHSILVELTGPVTLSGKVSGSSKKPSATMILDYSTNNTSVDGYSVKSIKEQFDGKFAFDFTNSLLVCGGTVHLSVDFKNPETGKYDTVSDSKAIKNRDFPMVSDMDGNWALVLDLTNNATKYTGTAYIDTSAGNEVDFAVTGTSSARTAKSTLILKSSKASDCNLTLVISDETMTFDSISGKVLGQTLSYKAPRE